MDQFNLLWETFEFHSFEGAKLEELHYKDMDLIKFLSANPPKISKKQQKEVLNQILLLINNYAKQIDSIDDLIEFNKEKGFPEDMEITESSLNSLKSLVQNLLLETKLYHLELTEFFG